MHEIRAEIPANVWQVLVDEGQLVAEGDDIVILESMMRDHNVHIVTHLMFMCAFSSASGSVSTSGS